MFKTTLEGTDDEDLKNQKTWFGVTENDLEAFDPGLGTGGGSSSLVDTGKSLLDTGSKFQRRNQGTLHPNAASNLPRASEKKAPQAFLGASHGWRSQNDDSTKAMGTPSSLVETASSA